MDDNVKSHVQIFVNGIRTATAYAEIKSKGSRISAEEFVQQLQEYLKKQLRNDEGNAGDTNSEKNIEGQRRNILSRLWDTLPPEAQSMDKSNNTASSQLSGGEEDESTSQSSESSIMEDLLFELNNTRLDRSKSCPCKHLLKKPKNLLRPAHKRSKSSVAHCEADLSFIQAIVWLKSAIAIMKQVPVNDFFKAFNKQWDLNGNSRTDDFCTIFGDNASSIRPLMDNLKHMKYDTCNYKDVRIVESNEDSSNNMKNGNNQIGQRAGDISSPSPGTSETSGHFFKGIGFAKNRPSMRMSHFTPSQSRNKYSKDVERNRAEESVNFYEQSDSLNQNKFMNANDSIDILKATKLQRNSIIGNGSAADRGKGMLPFLNVTQNSSEMEDERSPTRLIAELRKDDDFQKSSLIILETDDDSQSDCSSIEYEQRTGISNDNVDDSGFLSENIDSKVNFCGKQQNSILSRRALGGNGNSISTDRITKLLSTKNNQALELRPTVAMFRFDNSAVHRPSTDKLRLPKSILKIEDCQKKNLMKITKSVRFTSHTVETEVLHMANQRDAEEAQETRKNKYENRDADFIAKGTVSTKSFCDSESSTSPSPDISNIDLNRPFWEFRFSSPNQRGKVTTDIREIGNFHTNGDNVQVISDKAPIMSKNEQIKSKLYRPVDKPNRDVNKKFRCRDLKSYTSKSMVRYDIPCGPTQSALQSNYSRSGVTGKCSVKRRNEYISNSNIKISKRRKLEEACILSASLNYIIRTSETNDLLLRSVKTILGAIENEKIVACFRNWRGSMEKEAVEAVVNVIDILEMENASKSCKDEAARMIQRVFDKILKSNELGKATTWDQHTSIILELCNAVSICKETVDFLISKLKILTSITSRAPDESIIESAEVVERSFFIFRALDIVLRKYRELLPHDGRAKERKENKMLDVTELWKRHWNVEQRDDEVIEEDHEESWMNILGELAVASSENWPQVTMLAWQVVALLKTPVEN